MTNDLLPPQEKGPNRVDGSNPDDLVNQITIRSREGRIVEALVPIEIIEQSDVPVDHAHVNDLEDSIARVKASDPENETGQLAPVILGCINGEENLHIIDGFHRVASKDQSGDKFVLCRVLVDCTWEELFDHRIISATSHQATKIPRIIEWVQQAWSSTEWGDRTNVRSITAPQAFSMVERKSVGKGLGLNEDEAEAIKQWVTTKTNYWKISINTIDKHLRLIGSIDPELIKTARERAGKDKLEEITPQHLARIAKHLDGKFDHQRLVTEFAIKHNASVAVTERVSATISDVDDVDAISELMENSEWIKKMIAHRSKDSKKLSSVKAEEEGDLSNLVVDEIDLCRDALRILLLRKRYTAPRVAAKERHHINVVSEAVEALQPHVWTRDQRKEVRDVIGIAQEPVTTRLISKHGLFGDEAVELVDEAKKRIFQDIKSGALKFIGPLEKDQDIIGLFINTVNDEISMRRRRKAFQDDPNDAPYIAPKRKVLTLDLKSYAKAMQSLTDKTQRREVTLSAVLGLSVAIIAQVVDKPQQQVRNDLATLSKELGGA